MLKLIFLQALNSKRKDALFPHFLSEYLNCSSLVPEKPNLLSHLTSVCVVHLSVLVASDLWDDCNKKNIQLFFLSFLHYDSTSFSSQGQDYSSQGIGPKFQHFKCLTHKYFHHLRNLRVPFCRYTEHSLGYRLGWGGLTFFQRSTKPVLQIAQIMKH